MTDKLKMKLKSKILKGLSLNIVILGLVSLFTDLSSQMVFPLLPLFIVEVLGAGAFVVGLVEGAAETTASLLKVFSGYWSDRIKQRKQFVLAGYSLSTIMKPMFAFAQVWQSVLAFRITERVGKGVRDAPRDVIVVESTDPDTKGRAFGFHRAMDGIGSTLGPVLAFIFIFFFAFGYRRIFLISAIPALIAVILVLFVKEEKNTLNSSNPSSKRSEISFRAFPRKLIFFIIAATIFALGNFGYAFLLLRALEFGLEVSAVILLYVLYYGIYTILVFPTGIISDKIGREPVIIGGYGIFGVMCIGFVYASSLPIIVLLFATYGIFYAMIDGVQRAFVADLSPAWLKGTALGAFHTSTGLAALPAGMIAGLLWEYIGLEMTFLYGFCLSIGAIIILFLLVMTKE
jgi:MFS family permease